MRNPTVPIMTVLLVLLSSLPLAGQEVRQRRLDASTSLLMPEIGIVAESEEGAEKVTVGMVLPADVRPEANRGVDVAKGDAVLMMNGTRIRSLPKLRELYEALEEGDEIKLALHREGRRFLIGFEKGAEGDGSGVMVSRRGGHGGGTAVRVVAAGGDGEVELFHEARVLLGEQDGAVAVLTALVEGGELHEGDVVSAVNGTAVDSLDAFRKIYGALEIGQRVTCEVQRDDEKLEVGVAKAARPEGMMIRGAQ